MASRCSTAGLGYVAPTEGSGNTCIMDKADTVAVESHRYYLARRTVLEMLRDRGCVIADYEFTRTLTEFRLVFGDEPDPDHLRICVPLSSKPSKKILVIFCNPGDINKATAKHMLLNITNKDTLLRIILVLQGKMNIHARALFNESEVKVEFFPITELFVNITKHVAAPKHEILTAEQKEQMLKKYELADTQIPYMWVDDAIARYYGLEKKQVVKITYNSNITGSYVTYRCVI
ncbi:DNA-directed RNA polymerase V subunit 5C [Lactuca sativa]|uniref:RNA polymerase subunit H/Rpb5 C-terminal domain-containing protein n=1 Tax=Lactuca sativa TaxID=4236 RepID=A0A9R1XKN9_LACSA|nr:DNA-directed RNA polymerase V subunit 5C [Lactuca sativa]KAJ0213319.1 hypothetical protein LSAT_V11C400168930 [Lactuca sativa]